MRSPRVGPWGPNVRVSGAVARESPGGGGRDGLVRGHGRGSSSWWRPRAGGVRPHSLWWARQASGMCGGDGTVICGEPRVAAECTCTAREFGRCARPTVRPGRTVHDDRDHGDGSDTRPRGRRTNGSLTETSRSRLAVLAGTVRRVGGPAHEPRPAGRYRPRAWHVLAAGVEPDGPVDADGDQALVIYEARHPTVLPGGEAARPWDAATGALVRRPRRRRGSWPPLP